MDLVKEISYRHYDPVPEELLIISDLLASSKNLSFVITNVPLKMFSIQGERCLINIIALGSKVNYQEINPSILKVNMNDRAFGPNPFLVKPFESHRDLVGTLILLKSHHYKLRIKCYKDSGASENEIEGLREMLKLARNPRNYHDSFVPNSEHRSGNILFDTNNN